MKEFFSNKKAMLKILLIFISIIIRLINIQMPLVEGYAGQRQTFTTLPVQTWLQIGGVDMIHYQIPILGEPWRIPYEFPIYQVSGYFTFKILLGLGVTQNLDVAMRITSIAWFYLSAFFFYIFLKKIFYDKEDRTFLACSALAFYLFLPFSVLFSRVVLIDVCAMCFGIIYSYYFYLLMTEGFSHFKFLKLIVTIMIGIMGYLTKVTSMIPVTIFLACIGLRYLYIEGRLKWNWIVQKESLLYYFKLILATLIPVVPGVIWIKYADLVKTNAGLSVLTSEGLRDFNFGTWEQKTDLKNYGVILVRLNEVFPIIIFLVLIMLLLYLKSDSGKREFMIISSCIAIMGTIFVIFNLFYCHTYYFIAIFPFLCIILGISVTKIKEFVQAIPFNKVLKICIIMACTVVTISMSVIELKDEFEGSEGSRHHLYIGRAVKSLTSKEDIFILFNWGWDSTIPYYAERKAICVTGTSAQGPSIGPYETQKKKFAGVNYVLFCGRMDSVVSTLQYADTRDIFLMERIYEGYECNIYRKVEVDINQMANVSLDSISGSIEQCIDTNDGNYIITGHIQGVSGNGVAAYYGDGENITPIVTSLYMKDTLPYDYVDETGGDGFCFKVNKHDWNLEKNHKITVLIHKGSNWTKEDVFIN